MSVTINLDIPKIMDNIEAANELAIAAMSQQVLADSDYYCPQDQSMLIASAENNSDIKNGVIVWDTPYAQYLYYGLQMVAPNGSAWAKQGESKHLREPETKLNYAKDKNPNAQMMWFHKAKDVHGDEWDKVYAAAFKKAMK